MKDKEKTERRRYVTPVMEIIYEEEERQEAGKEKENECT